MPTPLSHDHWQRGAPRRFGKRSVPESEKSRRPIEVDWPAAALREASELVGVSAADAEVLRIGHCAVIALPRAGLVARIGRPGYPSDRLAAELRFALYVYEAGIPALRPAVEVTDQPIPTCQGSVT